MPRTIKKKSPSRIKYEQVNPTVSCRVPQEIYKRLKTIIAADGNGFADMLKIGLGIVEPILEKASDYELERYMDGFAEGYLEVENKYITTYRCGVCRKTMEIHTKEEKLAAGQYMTEKGWHHGECHRKYR
jgi:hypothetical protein